MNLADLAVSIAAANQQAPVRAEVTATSFTPTLTDIGKLVPLNNASAITITIPPHSDVAAPVGHTITVYQKGAGSVTFAEGSGVTINSRADYLETAGQYAVAQAIQTEIDTWLLVGDLI